MKKHCLFSIISCLSISCHTDIENTFIIQNPATSRVIYLDENSDDLIRWAANDLANDLKKIGGKEIPVKYTTSFSADANGIFIGQSGDPLIAKLPLNGSGQLQNQ